MRRILVSALALLSLAVAAAPSSAAPAQRFPLPDVSFVAPNPCTGDLIMWTLSDRVLMIHEDVDPTGRQHQAGTVTGEAATADGFSGRFTVTFGYNSVSDPLIVGEFRGFNLLGNGTFTLRNGDGTLFVVHVVSHVTVPAGPTGQLRGEVDILRAECLGKPS